MRYRRCKGASESFSVKVEGNFVIIYCFHSNKKYAEYKVDINDYLSRETAFKRRLFILEQDVNRVKSEMLIAPVYAIEGNIDCINKAIDAAIKEVKLYKPTLAERLEGRKALFSCLHK